MENKQWVDNEKTTEVTSDVENIVEDEDEEEYESDVEEDIESESDEESVHDLDVEVLYSDSEDDNDVVINIPIVVKQKTRHNKDKTIKILTEEAYIE